MASKKEALATIWELPDPIWFEVEAIILEDMPLRPTGRPRVDLRRVFAGIIFRMRSGCQWAKIPQTFGCKSTLHHWFQLWCARGVMQRIWERLVEHADECVPTSD